MEETLALDSSRAVFVFPEPAGLAEAAAGAFAEYARQAVATRGAFRVALAGGSTPLGLYARLAQPPHCDDVPWDRTEVFFGDERGVPPGDPERNDEAAEAALLRHVPLDPARVHRMRPEAGNGAALYESLLRERFAVPVGRVPRFDLVLLGIGADGHTASLFPGHSALLEQEALVVTVDSAPKPPRRRLSLTLRVLNAARSAVFLAAGAEKARAVASVLFSDRALPAAWVRPENGALTFFLDSRAAGGTP